MVDPTPLISFLISSTEEWPHARLTIESVLSQISPQISEVIIISSQTNPYPASAQEFNGGYTPQVIIFPDTDIFGLRRLGLQYCTGKWIVLLEDHNIPPAGWVDLLIAQIQSNQGYLAIVTSLINASETTAVDQANFLFNFGAYLPRVSHMPFDRLPIIAGACFNRNIIPDLSRLKDGELEMVYLPELYKKGKCFYLSQVAISHVQSNSVITTFKKHFYNARACAGLLKEINDNRIDWNSFKSNINAPIYFFRKWTVSPYCTILDLGYRQCWIYLVLFGFLFGIGSFMGWVAGKGNSAIHIE